MTAKRALITGITGQDGSYLAEFLLEQGYDVYGLVRRTSTLNFERIQHIQDRINLVSGDILDQTSLNQAVREIKPTEIYNLAAQSFVQTSWNQPVFTGDVTALGVTRILDAIRSYDPAVRFYQASSSEMFGKVQEVPQKETTPFYPRSPYGVAKVYGHWITVNYRESYNLHATSGILFNHECVTANTPVIIRKQGMVDIVAIEDIVPHRLDASKGTRYTTPVQDDQQFEVWDANGWVAVTCMTATWNGFKSRPNKVVHRVAARGAVYEATSDHVVFVCDKGQSKEKSAGEVHQGDELALIELPPTTDTISMTEDEAWLLGMICAEGSIKEKYKLVVTNQDQVLLDEVAACWHRITGGTTSRRNHPSGFPNGREVTQMRLQGAGNYVEYIRKSLYTRTRHKRIPKRILNAPQNIRLAFLKGFHAGDGLKRANGIYEYKGFKTVSPVLAMGLYWLAQNTLNQRAIVCTENRNGRLYYQINLNSPNAQGQKGQHLRRPLEEVVKADPIEYKDWLFDLATASGTFHAGVGQGWIHNSPRRGLEFSTRKVTYHAAKISLGLTKELRVGNLDAQRDWGYAADYVRAMWLMLQQDKPDDYLVATGKTHTVQRLIEVAFNCVDLNWRDYVVQDERFMRPAEVDLLIGDASKARAVLGWEPSVTFEQLIEMMVKADYDMLKKANGL